MKAGEEIRWWVGFTPKPLDAEFLRGISILAHKKMLQRPFMFERTGGVTGQLGQEYVVGELIAEWLDDGTDIEDDLIQTNRDQLQLEDARIGELLNWGQRRLRWALSRRQALRREESEKVMEEPVFQDLIKEFTKTEQKTLTDIGRKASDIGDPSPESTRAFMTEVVSGFKDRAVRELMERVQVQDPEFQTSFWGLVREFSLIDARKNYSLIQARLETIDRLDKAIVSAAREVPEIHGIVREFPWLLDPRWSLLGDEVDLSTISEQHEPIVDGETGQILDYLFILQPKAPATLDQLLVVEIKRGYDKPEKKRTVNENEVQKFYSYVLGVREHYRSGNTQSPTVGGLMIAEKYSARADRMRMSLQQLSDVRLEFKTWGGVIENTRRLHTSWLEVTRKTAGSE